VIVIFSCPPLRHNNVWTRELFFSECVWRWYYITEFFFFLDSIHLLLKIFNFFLKITTFGRMTVPSPSGKKGGDTYRVESVRPSFLKVFNRRWVKSKTKKTVNCCFASCVRRDRTLVPIHSFIHLLSFLYRRLCPPNTGFLLTTANYNYL
jgi:hypothetical protein